MVETALPSHPPAIKVGGRRLSVNTRPKPQASGAEAATESPTDTKEEGEEESPKKEKKINFDKHAQRKADNTRPTRDTQGNFKSFSGARIAQPAGKAFGI
ncbi:hypothetical protein D9611_005206 [Ephemerocybe angulata]|uniref:PEST proteolytic signal-containing nuclear protein n=1 Tax=Ephemerocybe angulata TaxID=980116 RepID=A0A8H5C0K9_9AGAR|nr:hypothetical protein D9611_005206 [Tulosesus angulatus]